MKKTLFILILLIYGFSHAQEETNRFKESESTAASVSAASSDPAEDFSGPPGDDDLPIDDYIPVLAITAIGIIVYVSYRRKSLAR